MTRTDVPTRTRQPTPTPRRSWAWAFAGAVATVVVAIGVVGLVVGGGGDSTGPESTLAVETPAPGSWTRTVLQPGFHARELTVTSFGLVAAAETDGVWISEDGTTWRQALAGPFEPYEGTTTTLSPPLTAPPPGPDTWSSVQGVAEYDGRLYAFGIVGLDLNTAESTNRVVVWSSGDAVTWDETIVLESRAQQNALFLSAAIATDDVIAAYEDFGSRVLYSTDGVEWTLLDASATGLEGVALTDVVHFDGQFWALGESSPDGDENSRGIRAVYTSPDGLHFEKTPGRDFTEDELPVSLVWHDGRLFASGHRFDPELGEAMAGLWHSSDGIEWQETTIPPPAEPGTAAAHSPIPDSRGLVIPVSYRYYSGDSELSVFLTRDTNVVEPVPAPAGVLEEMSEEVTGGYFDGRLILLGRAPCRVECDLEPPLYQVTLTP